MTKTIETSGQFGKEIWEGKAKPYLDKKEKYQGMTVAEENDKVRVVYGDDGRKIWKRKRNEDEVVIWHRPGLVQESRIERSWGNKRKLREEGKKILGYEESMIEVGREMREKEERKEEIEEEKIRKTIMGRGSIMLKRGLDEIEKVEKRKLDIKKLLGEAEEVRSGEVVVLERNGKKCMRDGCGRRTVSGSKYCREHGGEMVEKAGLLKEGQVPLSLLDVRYDPAVHPMLFITLSREGKSDVEIAAEFEVSLGTLRVWAETYEEFNTAFEVGKAMHESWFLTVGRENLGNARFNTPLFKFLTGNKLGYADKVESKNLNLHAGVLVVPKRMGEQEWEDSI